MSVAASPIADAFSAHGKRAALMPYLMGGYPSIGESVEAGLAAADAGADLLELGIPFSDPLADGPVIHAAGTAALAAGATPFGVLSACERLAARVPVVLMVYSNIVFTAGAAGFALRAASVGASGLIVPDLPHDEAGELREACDAEGIALVPLVAPTSTPERIAEIGADARGFVYTVSLTGTTGERLGAHDAGPLLARVKAHADVPVALGFGISTPEQAAAAADAGADGVIVGSRLVRAAAEAAASGGDPAAAVAELVAGLAAGLTR
jgi:tryptophan synthase alpha chain